MTAHLVSGVVAGVRDVQPPLLAAVLIGACAAKLARMLRTGPAAAGLGPAELFPVRLRRPLAGLVCVVEVGLGAALVLTALPGPRRPGPGPRLAGGLPVLTTPPAPVLSAAAATGVRIAAAAFFLVATCALIEMRGRHPDAGCGCFGDLSVRPAGLRPIARSLVLATAALVSLSSPALYLPPWGRGAVLLPVIVCAELVVLMALSPEAGEALVRLGYTDPCELRSIPARRSLTALRRSRQWRRNAAAITTDAPVDMWRELCWRFVVFPSQHDGTRTEVVFAVQMKTRRPAIQSAIVPAGEVTGAPGGASSRPPSAGLAWAGPASAGLAASGPARPDGTPPVPGPAVPAGPPGQARRWVLPISKRL